MLETKTERITALHAQEKSHLAKAKRLRNSAADYFGSIQDLYQNRVELGEIYEKEAQTAKQKNIPWSDWCEEQLPVSKRQADKYRLVYACRSKVPALVKEGTLGPNLDKAVVALPTLADAKKLAYATGDPNKKGRNDSNQWHTPVEYIEAAREVLRTIDFDPFSSATANQTVRATEFYTKETDALITPWPLHPAGPHHTVFMNPPYGRSIVNAAVEVFLNHLPQIHEAIVLVNNATETKWFDNLSKASTAECHTNHRIQFESTDKHQSSNTRGQVFFYFGPDKPRFCAQFSQFGRVLEVCNASR